MEARRTWEKLGLWVVLLGFVLIGITTMAAYQPIPAGSIYYDAYILGQNAAILQGIGWILVGLGLLLRFYPTSDAQTLKD